MMDDFKEAWRKQLKKEVSGRKATKDLQRQKTYDDDELNCFFMWVSIR